MQNLVELGTKLLTDLTVGSFLSRLKTVWNSLGTATSFLSFLWRLCSVRSKSARVPVVFLWRGRQLHR